MQLLRSNFYRLQSRLQYLNTLWMRIHIRKNMYTTSTYARTYATSIVALLYNYT